MEDKILWIHRCKSMVLYSFNYMLSAKDRIRQVLSYYDSEWDVPEMVMEAVDEYVDARDDCLFWKRQLLQEYGWKQ